MSQTQGLKKNKKKERYKYALRYGVVSVLFFKSVSGAIYITKGGEISAVAFINQITSLRFFLDCLFMFVAWFCIAYYPIWIKFEELKTKK